jgi:hypothetical protein
MVKEEKRQCAFICFGINLYQREKRDYRTSESFSSSPHSTQSTSHYYYYYSSLLLKKRDVKWDGQVPERKKKEFILFV